MIFIVSYLFRDTITETCLIKYNDFFTTKKGKLSDKNSYTFPISSQNRDCGYSLEPPRGGGSNEYSQSMFFLQNKKHYVYCKTQFYHIKVGLKGEGVGGGGGGAGCRHVVVMDKKK